MKANKCAVCALFFFVFCSTYAQDRSVSQGNLQWFQYYSQIKLNEKWFLQTDGGYRWNDGFEEQTQYIVRTGAKYAINKKYGVGAGFAHLGFYADQNLVRIEFRPYQELSMNSSFGALGIDHRLRAEERFFKSVENGNDQAASAFGLRFRYLIMASIPICKLSKTKPDQKLLLNVGNEVFIQLGSDGNETIFDQNRFLISPALQFNQNLAVSLTYNNQVAATTTANHYNHTHIIWVKVRHKIDAKKNEGPTFRNYERA